MSVTAIAAIGGIVTCGLGLLVQIIIVTRWFSKLESKIDQHTAVTEVKMDGLGERIERVEGTLANGSIIVLDPRKHVRIELDPQQKE